jgi:hypothetical protein
MINLLSGDLNNRIGNAGHYKVLNLFKPHFLSILCSSSSEMTK